MNTRSFAHAERGSILVVSLIMLLLFTLLVSGALTMNTVNLKAVGNMQAREEAIAAANVALEYVTSTNFTNSPTALVNNVDINDDGVNDYVVSIAAPTCIRATVAQAAAASSVKLGSISNNTWNTVWSFSATVVDQASGTSTQVRSGVRVLLPDAQKSSVCP